MALCDVIEKLRNSGLSNEEIGERIYTGLKKYDGAATTTKELKFDRKSMTEAPLTSQTRARLHSSTMYHLARYITEERDMKVPKLPENIAEKSLLHSIVKQYGQEPSSVGFEEIAVAFEKGSQSYKERNPDEEHRRREYLRVGNELGVPHKDMM